MEITTFKIKGMTCDHCATSIAKIFNDRQGVGQNKISYPEGSGKFAYDPEIISKKEIIEIINSTGHYIWKRCVKIKLLRELALKPEQQGCLDVS